MVLLSMTPAVVAAVVKYRELQGESESDQLDSESALAEPAVGKPISHAQIIDISKFLKEKSASSGKDDVPCHLNELLRGSFIYTPPPEPKPEPTSEYKILMARLREEEEARAYERMLNPPPTHEAFTQRFPNARMFPSAIEVAKEEDDEVTYADVNRQMALIINVLVSIIACSVAVWVAARHLSTPYRLALSMTSSVVVAVAEVAIYTGYIRRVREAKQTEKVKTEKKEILDTWVIDANKERRTNVPKATSVVDELAEPLRSRKGKHR